MARKKPIISPLGQWAYPGEVTVIPSSNITMKGVNYPVLGIDDLGNQQMMMPGGEYTFPGNYVTEYPQMQFGGMSKRKIDKILNENKDLNFVQRMYQPNTPSIMIPGQQYPATHFMASGDGRVYPTVVQMPDGTLQYLGDNAYDYANQSGQYIEFPNDRQARRFAKSYKKGTGVLEEFGKGGLSQWFDEKWVDVKTGKTCGRSGKDKDGRPYPACRPSRRVNETTPKTTSEMSSAEKARFKREKTSGKRIDYNHKRREDGGETWLDQYPVGGETSTEQNPERMQGVNINVKRKKVSDNPTYEYDNEGNLLYKPDINIHPYLLDNSTRDNFWVNPKLPIKNLNPTVEEFRQVAAPYYPIDNKLINNPKLTFKYNEAKPSNYQASLEQEYVLPEVVGKSFGNFPLVKDDGYSPNRRWLTNLRDGDKDYKNSSAINVYGPGKYAYVLKTDHNNLVNYPTKDKIENDLSLNNKTFYDYLAKNKYSPDTVDGLTRELPDQIWNRAEQMQVEMRNNPEIMSWANLHNVDLGYKERYWDSEDNDDFAPKIPESIYAARLAQAGLPTNRPDYDYDEHETYIAQDPSKFSLVDYFPVDSFLKDANNNPKNKKNEWGTVDDQILKKQMAKRMGLDLSAFNNGEYLIHYNNSPITEYIPGKKYGGWLDQYQDGGVRRPIYTSNSRDPRIGSYRDSLNLYNKGEQDKQKYINVVKNAGLSIGRLETSPPPYNFISGKIAPISQMALGYRGSYGNITLYERQLGLPKGNTSLNNLRGDAEISDASGLGKYLKDRAPILYKKPVQPIYYGVNTKLTPSKKSILTKVSQPIYNKPEIIPDVVQTPLPVTPIELPVKKIGYNKPIIQQFNYMSNENKAKALQKYGSVGDIPFQGVDINQLKDGGWLDEFQVGGGRAPMYTSDPNDPRLQRFNDSASLHNSNFFIPNKDVFYRSNAELKKSFCKDINCYGLVRDGVKQNKKQKLEYIKGIQPTGYDNFPNKSDYNKGLSTEILFPEPVQPIIYQPSLVVSNIDRDMYTPNGGMAREYNIGVTLQDGSKKAFRTEKEYQDWKTANNLDITNAKVTEGKGYSYNYPENKKYGGWLSKYQEAGEAPPGKSVQEYTNQFNEEISGLKDWYEANRKRIGDTVPEAYLRNDLKNAKKEYGPQPDPENYNSFVTDQEYDNPRITGVRSKYDPVTNTFNERYIPPAFPFNFPELKIGFDNSKNPEESAIGIPNSYTYTNSRVKNNSFVVPYSSDYNKQLKNKGYIKDQKISVDPTAIDLYTYKNDPSTIMSHETSHYLNKNNPEVFLFNRTKLAEMGITDTEGFNNYYSTTLNNDRKEDELLSDAYALKQDMRKKGFYDYTKGEKLTPKIWNKYKKEYPDNFIINRFTPVFENQGKNNIEQLYNRNNSIEGINNIDTLNDNYDISDPFSPYLKNTKETPTFKTSDERIIHLLNGIVKNDNKSSTKYAKYGGWLNKYPTGGAETSTEQNPDRMQAVDIRKKRSWSDKLRGFINQGEKAIGLDPYNERSDDFMEQWARRVNNATGGRDWYKQPNDASGPGGIGTAMMETIMAPFSAPQLASVYGATGKVQMPSEAMNIQNPYLAFGVNAVTDPLSHVGAGLTRTGQKFIKGLSQQAGNLLESQIKKNPRLALSLQKGRPVSLDNVNTVSGIQYGDVSSVANVNKLKPNTISEHAFFRQLEKGVGSLDNSVGKRVADLESEEGFRRLVEQEKAYLFDNTDTDLSVIDRVAKINAKARIEELKNVKNVNKEATEYANTNFLGTGLTNPFVEDSYLYNNAYHRPASLYDQFVKSSGTLNLKKPTPNYSKSIPGEIGMGYNFVGDVPTEMHEIGHVLQRGRKLSLDTGLKNIVPKKQLKPSDQRGYKYFMKGSSGSEPTAFANELRESMFQKGFIPDYYTPINQQQIQNAYKYFKKNPMGVYNKNTGNFSSNTRIFDFMEPTKANSKLLTDVLNRLPAVAPLAVGAAAASQLQEQKKGGQTSWLNKYK
jgi:hypothetical protein